MICQTGTGLAVDREMIGHALHQSQNRYKKPLETQGAYLYKYNWSCYRYDLCTDHIFIYSTVP